MARLPERILAVFLTFTTALALALPGLQPEQRWLVLRGNACVLVFFAVVLLVARRHPKAEPEWLSIVRDWAALAAMIFCYHEMGWFARPDYNVALENMWLGWDRVLLYRWGVKAAIESTGVVLPTVLEAAYLFVYAMPVFVLAMIYVYRRRKRADEFLTIYMLGLMLAYVQFPFWPSEPPRTVFAGQDLPALLTPVRILSLWVLTHQGIHTSVFPSAHVSGAVAAAFAARRVFRDTPWLRRGVPVYAALVAVATVYGRYHYAADALAGALMGTLAYVFVAWLRNRTKRA